METTGKNLVEHWEWAADRGLMNKNTANGLRAACSQVLGVLEDWENVDVSNLDVNDAIRRFQNLRKRDFKPKTLDVYKGRFKTALASYLSYLADPGSWKPLGGSDRSARVNAAGASGSNASGPNTTSSISAVPTLRIEDLRGGLMEYPFPLREALTVKLSLPRDLKTSEVKRLHAFLTTLAVDHEASENG